NGIVERRNRTLVEAARTMLSAVKVPLFFWAEAIATACFTQNRSLEKGDECIFVGYSTQSRAYKVFNKRTSVIMESIHVNFDELPQMASVQNSSDPAPTRQKMASAHNSSDPAPTCQKKASVQISSDPALECQTMALEYDSLSPRRTCQENVSHRDKTDTTSNELDLLFSPMFDELLNGSSKVVSKSSTVSDADAPNHRQQPTTPLNNHTTPAPTCQTPPITTSVISSKNINQAEPHAENDEVADDEESFTISLNIYKEYLAEFWYSTKALENSKVSFSVPTNVTSKEVGPQVACWSLLCISTTTGVESEVWLGLDSMAELDSFFLFKWPILEPVGALEDLPFVASLLDTEGCFKEVECFLCPDLAPGFMPWGTLSALGEGLGTLNTTGSVALQIANMWSMKRGSLGLGFEILVKIYNNEFIRHFRRTDISGVNFDINE
nr:retrovirus-related Pol polyprotein from transposon TNT 1-94 [Tanacetum cinerariifolium]